MARNARHSVHSRGPAERSPVGFIRNIPTAGRPIAQWFSWRAAADSPHVATRRAAWAPPQEPGSCLVKCTPNSGQANLAGWEGGSNGNETNSKDFRTGMGELFPIHQKTKRFYSPQRNATVIVGKSQIGCKQLVFSLGDRSIYQTPDFH